MSNQYIVGVTGHRPEKIKPYNENLLLQIAKHQLWVMSPTLVVSGMARGWDLIVLLACHSLEIPYKAVIPFEGQESKWSKKDQEQYQTFLKLAVEVENLDLPKTGKSFLKRDEILVDQVDSLLALYDEEKQYRSGTGFTVRYAEKTNRVTISNVWKAYEINN